MFCRDWGLAATQGSDLMAIALAHGLAIGLLVVALGAISGGHFNPAVTFAMLITGRMTLVGALGYWVVQLFGGWSQPFSSVPCTAAQRWPTEPRFLEPTTPPSRPL